MSFVTISPERFTEARIERRVTQAKLAEKVGVTPVTISNLERGVTRNPSMETVASIAWALKKPVEFFYEHAPLRIIDASVPTFRSKSSKSVRDNKYAFGLLQHCKLVLQCLYEYVNARYLDIPDGLDFVDPMNISMEEIEDLAYKLRALWGMSDGPIIKLSTLLENKGLICFPAQLPEKIDSINLYTKIDSYGGPAIILYNSSANYFRQRFSLAHELGHVILHRSLTEDAFDRRCNLFEDQANRFASAFLMPKESFERTIVSVSLNGAFQLKELWRASIGSILHRFYNLGYMSESKYIHYNVEMSRKGWKKAEPMDDEISPERPYYMSHGFRFVFENGLASASDVLTYCRLSVDELVSYIGNENFFRQSAPINDFTFKI